MMGGPRPGQMMGGNIGQLGGNAGGNPGGDSNEKKDATLTLTFETKLLVLQADVNFPSSNRNEAYNALMAQFERQVLGLKAKADLLSKQPWAHQLALAVKAYFDTNKQFPRGTIPRPDPNRALPYRPDQRLSFYADLVPYLGEEYREWRFPGESGWSEGRGLKIAQRVIPHLVGVRQDGPVPIMVDYPGVDVPLAGTCWVGMAGVGYDAATYDDSSPKRGVFGYDRVTKKEHVKDKLAETIVLIMVPPGNAAPWLAGGGATVRGVADADEDKKPLEPFVCMTFRNTTDRKSPFDGKKGTLAIMGDGKVRFIPEDVPAADFLAMCTIAGGETLSKPINQLAPVIEDDGERELKGGGLPKEQPKQEEPKKEEPKSKDQAQAPKGWQTVTSKAGGYSVFMPGRPNADAPAPGTEAFTLEAGKSKMIFTVVEHDDLLKPGAAEVNLAAFVQAAAQGARGKIGREAKTTFNSHVGKEFEIVTMDGKQVMGKCRVYVIGKHLVAQAVAGEVSDGDTKTFFESLQQAAKKDDTKK
jgi:hypothetical protein